jgi:hypothetical protein
MSRKWANTIIWLGIGSLCLLLFFPCARTIRDTPGRVRSANNIKQIAVALHSYHETNGHLPPAVVRNKDGQPLYSWRVALLPYLEENSLYEQFRLNEPWDSEHNKKFLDKTPSVYASWWRDEPGQTRYQVLVGPGTAFERPELTWADFPDGPGSTLLVVEAGTPVPWTKPAELVYDPAGPLLQLGGVHSKPVRFLCREWWREPGFVAGFADGSVRFVRSSTDERTIRALITRNGGEPVDPSDLE